MAASVKQSIAPYLAPGMAAAALIALAAFWLTRPAAEHPGLLQVNGRMEGDRVTVAPKLAGRIAELRAREGDEVKAGQVLARLDDASLRARLERARAMEDSLRAQIAAQEAALAVLRGETAVALATARAQLAAAHAELRRAESAAAQGEREWRRAQELSGQGFVGPQSLERAELAARQGRDQQDAAASAVAQARESLRDAQLGPRRIAARQAELAATRARLREAAAAVSEVQAALDDLTISAPIDGTVTSRYANVGEVVDAGSPLLELIDLDRLYLKGYVPEPMIGQVRRGMAARIYADAFPDQPFAATVRYIASRAEFTPKEVQTVDERVKLVFEVRLYPDANPGGRLNPGQPADGVIRWREDAQWARPHR